MGRDLFNLGNYNMKFIHVQSVLPQKDVIALKEKSGESSVKEAIARAVYHYLKCELANKDEES